MSTIPGELPQQLRSKGRVLSGVDRGLVAWPREVAIAVLESLEGSSVGIAGGEVLRAVGDGHLPQDDWFCHAVGKETAAEYAQRSRRVARDYCRRYLNDAMGPIWIIFHFEDQHAAA